MTRKELLEAAYKAFNDSKPRREGGVSYHTGVEAVMDLCYKAGYEDGLDAGVVADPEAPGWAEARRLLEEHPYEIFKEVADGRPDEASG